MSAPSHTAPTPPLMAPLDALAGLGADVVGGKAAGLLRLRQAGLEVPDAVVMTTAFFTPWLEALAADEGWRNALEAARHDAESHALATACEAAQGCVPALALDAERTALLDSIPKTLGPGPYAVRSSSPQEDQASASFAGLYETVLGVHQAALEAAVRQCFASCLAERVLRYKVERGFEDLRPAIAVIVQRQVESEVAGVTFSINPLTNDYDELLINASWGLGEALVSGALTPDSVVVDKVSGTIVSQQAGDKGGDRPGELCLAAPQVAEILAGVRGIEPLFDDPVDVEWAFAGGRLHWLQARPVTAWVPLHESLLTEPGAPRRLYVDGYLTDAITMSTAITPLSEDVTSLLYELFFKWMFGTPFTAANAARFGMHTAICRLYLDVSMYLHLMTKPGMAEMSSVKNPIIGALLATPEIQRYRPAKPPPHARTWRVVGSMLAMYWRMRGVLMGLFAPAFWPRRFQATYQRTIAEFNEWMARPLDHSRPIAEEVLESAQRAGTTIAASSMPAFTYSFYLQYRIRGLANPKSPEQVAWANTVSTSHEEDMIVQMGTILHDMAQLLPAAEFDDISALEEKLRERQLPPPFLAKWDEFEGLYGCRGPLEMELANPKYGDAPRIALRQMAGLVAAGDAGNPRELARRQAERRRTAFDNLLAALPRRKARRLRKRHAASANYGAARELFKHHVMQIFGRARALVLHRAEAFVKAGRLDRPEQIFELTLNDVERAQRDASFDLRAAVAERGAHYRRLKPVPHFPMFIDSRGRILRLEPPVRDGALVGTAVSPGVAQGPVKVLNHPFEKPVEPGDVLVAVTTDPGWTPLFISAAAVILEHGSELQHGALVAREYGKPCVTGIQDVTTRFSDGQRVEVDGAAGTVRVLETA